MHRDPNSATWFDVVLQVDDSCPDYFLRMHAAHGKRAMYLTYPDPLAEPVKAVFGPAGSRLLFTRTHKRNVGSSDHVEFKTLDVDADSCLCWKTQSQATR